MSVSKKTAVKKEEPKEEKRFPVAKLLRSRHLAGYQPDFAKVVLTEPEYTISEAQEALERNLKGER